VGACAYGARSGVVHGLAGHVRTAHPWRMPFALHRPYRLLSDRYRLAMEPIRGLLVSGVLTLHSLRVGVVVLQCGNEERNVIVGNVEFHSALLSPDFPRSDAACRPLAAAGTCEVLGLDGVGALSVLALGGGDSQPHFLAYRAGQEAAH